MGQAPIFPRRHQGGKEGERPLDSGRVDGGEIQSGQAVPDWVMER